MSQSALADHWQRCCTAELVESAAGVGEVLIGLVSVQTAGEAEQLAGCL